MSGHTPGPWLDNKGTTTGRVVVAPDQPKVRYSVAACGGPNRDANACLIASAPDMLKALKAVEHWLTAALECKQWVWDADQREYATEDRDSVRAAIAKATGQ